MSTKDYAYQLLKAKVTELHSEALAQRSMFQIGKASGIGATALGVVGCIGFPPLGVLATVGGLGLWLTSVCTEAVTTGDITPLPWVSTRLTAIASSLDRASDYVATADDKELAEYLSAEEQVLYLLLVTQGARVAELLSHVDEDLWDTTLTAIVTKAKQMFGKGGFVLASALSEGGEFLDHSAETLSIPLPVRPQIATQPVAKQLVGEQTRLTSVDVPSVSLDVSNVPSNVSIAQPLEDFWSTSANTEAVQWSTEVPTVDHLGQVKSVVDRNNSFYIVGSKGAGKGMFAANLLRWKLEQYPDAIALILDPKGDDKEKGYWKHPKIKHFAFKSMTLDSAGIRDKVCEFLVEYRNLVSQADITKGKRVFVVFDEFLFLKTNLDKQVFDEISRACSNAISTGDSEGIHAIAITQSFNASDSVGSDEILKNLTQVGLFREDEYSRAKKQVNYGRVNRDSFTEAEFKSMARQSPVDRVMSIAGEFLPTPTLENHSSFDRDKGQLINQ